jgi:hypothetical protein
LSLDSGQPNRHDRNPCQARTTPDLTLALAEPITLTSMVDLFLLLILVILVATAIRMWTASRLYNSPAMGMREWFFRVCHGLFSQLRCWPSYCGVAWPKTTAEAVANSIINDHGAIIFGDLIGKLDMLRIECRKCGRSGRYRLADLIMRYGWDEKLFAFTADVTANCTRKQARSETDPCGAICPDLPKVV